MRTCPDCKTRMKPLFGATLFCPNDCDKKPKAKKPCKQSLYERIDKLIANTYLELDELAYKSVFAPLFDKTIARPSPAWVRNYKYAKARSVSPVPGGGYSVGYSIDPNDDGI